MRSGNAISDGLIGLCSGAIQPPRQHHEAHRPRQLDAKAKAEVINLLKAGFGWKEVMDLGDIAGARAQEMYLPLWLRLFVKLKSPNLNIHVAF